jgi:uncharacterized delta-60 repeat protein
MSIARKLGARLKGPYWFSVAGGGVTEWILDVAIDSDDNVIIAGATNSISDGGFDPFIAKLDPKGELLWANRLGGTSSDQFLAVVVDSNNNIIAAGHTQSAGAGQLDAIIAKYDSSGVLVANYTLGGTGNEYFYGVTVDAANNIIAVGSTSSDGAGGTDALIAKFNSDLAYLWAKTLGGSGNDRFSDVSVDSANNYIVAGFTGSDGAGSIDGLIVKIDPNGALLWDFTLGGTSSDAFARVVVDQDNHILATGTLSTGTYLSGVFVAKFNGLNGAVIWQKVLDLNSYQNGHDIALDSANDVIITGKNNNNGFVAKLSSTGNVVWANDLIGVELKGVKTDSENKIIVAGYAAGTDVPGTAAVVLKLNTNGSGFGTYFGKSYQKSALVNRTVTTLTHAPAVLTFAPAVLTFAGAALPSANCVLTTKITRLPL